MAATINASNLHKPRTRGQGYTCTADVLELINSRKFNSLEHFLESMESGMTEAEAMAELSEDEQKLVRRIYIKMSKWITTWSNYIDDRIRSKYIGPFPDYPYAPESLALACSYYVVHALYTFEGGHIGNREEDGEPTYYDYAEKILRGILDGSTHLETSFTLPIKDETGTVIATENILIKITGDIMAQHYSDNPMSMANQDREFGYAVTSRNGGSGYRQIGIGIDYSMNRDDYD